LVLSYDTGAVVASERDRALLLAALSVIAPRPRQPGDLRDLSAVSFDGTARTS
jgi:hypothetical protein